MVPANLQVGRSQPVSSIAPNRIEEVFHSVLRNSEPGMRASMLARECGDDSQLRDRVAALLEAHDNPIELPRLVSSDVVVASSAPTIAGTLLAGRYRLIQEIAEGGMGTVWLSDQVEPVQRKVALKLVKPGMDSRRVLARFDAERQALALMDHSNIARVFDGGLTDEGRPFFVMEYVPGTAITVYCDEARLPVSERLALFTRVCRAVHHAHQKGVIHRDLKPSNILVSREEDRAVPKVIDFGLAKAIHEPLTDESLSRLDVIIGTPRYMSPEQAERNNLDIDTRSDVYSLGVVLFELLTGGTPLEIERLERVGVVEALRLINDEPLPRPSERLSSSRSLASIAAARGCDSLELQRQVRGDLDWIVMKALERDRSLRYQSASDLASDLDRYLRDEPVSAQPPSIIYRLRKFARRHRRSLLAAFLVSASLIAGTITSSILAIRAVKAARLAEDARAVAVRRQSDLDKALANEATLRHAAQNERNIAEERRARAESSFREARAAINSHISSLMQHERLKGPAMEPLRRELFGLWLEYFKNFANQHADDPAMRAAVAETYFWISNLSNASGFPEHAMEALQEAAQRYEQVLRERPDVLENWQSCTYTVSSLGAMQQTHGRFAAAEVSLRRAIELHQSFVENHPGDRTGRYRLARAYLGICRLNLTAEQLDQAALHIQRALEIFEGLEREGINDREEQRGFAYALETLAILQHASGQLDQAVISSQRAHQICTELASDDSSFRTDVIRQVYQRGHFERIAGDTQAAAATYQRVIDDYRELARDTPSDSHFPRASAGARVHLGVMQASVGQKDAAMQSWTAALTDFHAAEELGHMSHGQLVSKADVLALLGRWPEAIKTLGKAYKLADDHWRPHCQIALLHRANNDAVKYRASCHDLVTRYGLDATGLPASAIVTACVVDASALENWSELLLMARRASEAEPENPAYLTLLGSALCRAGRVNEGLEVLERSLSMPPLAESSPPAQLDLNRASRLIGETIRLVARREQGSGENVESQVKAQNLVREAESKGYFYCDKGDSWRIAFAVQFAQRELTNRVADVDADK